MAVTPRYASRARQDDAFTTAHLLVSLFALLARYTRYDYHLRRSLRCYAGVIYAAHA